MGTVNLWWLVNIKLTKSQIKTIRMALYLASEWELSLVDANRMSYGPGKWCDTDVVYRCKNNIRKFTKLRASLAQHIQTN
jgi:hypothetical protein